MAETSSCHEKDRATAGLFLLGLAALALLDWWFPGGVVLVGGVGLFRYQSPRARRLAWVVFAIGGLFSLWDGMQWAGLTDWFPVVMVIVGAGLLVTTDLAPRRPADDP